MTDLFPEVESDPEVAARRRTWARHQHNRVVDPQDNERYTPRSTLAECMRLANVSHIDIDCAACPEAHCAPEWLGRQLDGSFRDALGSSWAPTNPRRLTLRVGWLNQPYDSVEGIHRAG